MLCNVCIVTTAAIRLQNEGRYLNDLKYLKQAKKCQEAIVVGPVSQPSILEPWLSHSKRFRHCKMWYNLFRSTQHWLCAAREAFAERPDSNSPRLRCSMGAEQHRPPNPTKYHSHQSSHLDVTLSQLLASTFLSWQGESMGFGSSGSRPVQGSGSEYPKGLSLLLSGQSCLIYCHLRNPTYRLPYDHAATTRN